MIRNKDIRDKAGVTFMVVDKMTELKLRWFGHVKRRSFDVPVRRCDKFSMVGLRREDVGRRNIEEM